MINNPTLNVIWLLMSCRKGIAKTLSSLDKFASDGIMLDGVDKLEQQWRPLLRFEIAQLFVLWIFSLCRRMRCMLGILNCDPDSCFRCCAYAQSACIILIQTCFDFAGLVQPTVDDKVLNHDYQPFKRSFLVFLAVTFSSLVHKSKYTCDSYCDFHTKFYPT